MDQRSICLFLDRKGLSALEIHNELVAVLGTEAVADSTITRYLRQDHLPAIMSEPPTKARSPLPKTQFLTPLRNNHSLVFKFSKAHLHSEHHGRSAFNKFTRVCREVSSLVSHDLTEPQERQRVTLSNHFLRELCSIKHQDRQFIITFDESWFQFTTDHEQIWL
jgi:hypothetical protein